MFDDRGAAQVLPGDPPGGEWSVPPAVDEELTEDEWQALVEWQIAADPQARPEPSAGEVAAAASREPMSWPLIAQLSRIDAGDADDPDLTKLARGWSRVNSSLQAPLVDVVEEMLRRATSPTSEWVDTPASVAAELGAALRLGAGAAGQLVTVTMQLAGPLTATREALRRGDVPWGHVVYLAEATLALSDEHAQAVEALVLGKAGERTPARHRDAVRRAVDRVDPDGADERRRQASKDVALIRFHHGAGMGELFARMPSEELDLVYLGADTCARRWKAAGDPRTLDELRVAALVHWARTFLTTGVAGVPDEAAGPPPADATTPEGEAPSPAAAGTPAPGDAMRAASVLPTPSAPATRTSATSATAAPPAPSAPTRHGSRVSLGVVWDLTSLLGVTRHCGELLDSGATLPPAAMAEIAGRGVRVRRMLVDDHGHLVDLTRRRWRLPVADGWAGSRPRPDAEEVTVLGLVVEARVRDLLVTGDRTDCDDETCATADAITAALAVADPRLREVVEAFLAAPTTAVELDADPEAEVPSPALAEFVCLRDRHPTNPTAGPTAASAGDIDHIVPRSRGGRTVRANLTSYSRHWHVLKTHAGWTVDSSRCGWEWTSPHGDVYRSEPYDYRLGP